MTSYLLEVRRHLVGGEKRGLGAPVDLIEDADHEQRDDEADHQRAQEVQKDEPPGGHTCQEAQTQIRVVTSPTSTGRPVRRLAPAALPSVCMQSGGVKLLLLL